jgi:2-oxo-4-hydroxy-4-carboxy--5-ureidoimidazoline (OHCU) decarboxylase
MKTPLSRLNACPAAEFVAVCGPFFEHSPWIAERTAGRRPFASVDDLHRELCATVAAATREEQLGLIIDG